MKINARPPRPKPPKPEKPKPEGGDAQPPSEPVEADPQ